MTMFERLGGAEVVARAVASFHARLANDASLAIDRNELATLEPQQVAFMGWVFGAAAAEKPPAFAGLVSANLSEEKRLAVVGHLRGALLEIGVENEVAEEALILLERATRTESGLPFDVVVVETGGVRAEHSPEEFLAIPMRARAQLVLARAVSFFDKGQPVDRKLALNALRTASAAKVAP
jgi:truncated hemoglobin YjbI